MTSFSGSPFFRETFSWTSWTYTNKHGFFKKQVDLCNVGSLHPSSHGFLVPPLGSQSQTGCISLQIPSQYEPSWIHIAASRRLPQILTQIQIHPGTHCFSFAEIYPPGILVSDAVMLFFSPTSVRGDLYGRSRAMSLFFSDKYNPNTHVMISMLHDFMPVCVTQRYSKSSNSVPKNS